MRRGEDGGKLREQHRGRDGELAMSRKLGMGARRAKEAGWRGGRDGKMESEWGRRAAGEEGWAGAKCNCGENASLV